INDYSKVDVFGQLGEALANLNPKNNCLSSLKGLECRDKPVMDNIFEMLSLLTTDITQILIMEYWESGVGYELSKKAHFITSLHLLNSCSLLAKLSDFINLQELTLQCIHEQSCEYTDSLTSANIPILRDIAKLKFRCKHEYSLEYLSNLIDKSTGKLRKITIEGSRIKDRRCDLLMSTIANKCPNLKSCSIPISRTDPQIDRLLESCEQLKDLKLCAVLDTLDNENNDILLYQLLNCTPTRLRRLDFVDWKFSISAWELFLKTQSRTLLQRICYYWNENSKIASPSDEFLKACQQNKRDGILATYKGIDSYWK
ncbi:1465_t:CDS:2, partial [Gigaspora rosea]